MRFTITLLITCLIKTESFVLPTSLYDLINQNDPYSKYVRATLQSSGYIPHDDTFMNDYLTDIYGTERYDYERCECMGCFVNSHCIECLNKNVCIKISGTYCE